MTSRYATRRGSRFSAEESSEWLAKRMTELGCSGLQELADRSGIDKGSISRYFRQERSPSIEVIAPLCDVLEVAPETLLIALGAIERRGRN